jgi:hypothetical protein
MKRQIIFTVFVLSLNIVYGQLDTVKYQWPDPPFNSNKVITATFSEFRNTGSADHFHNAVDIGEPDHNPLYASLDGFVHTIGYSGSNSYVRVRSLVDGKWKHMTYLHINPHPSLNLGQSVKAGETVLGYIYQGMGHVHLIERELVNSSGSNGAEINNLRAGGGLTPFFDNEAPVIHTSTLKFYADNSSEELSAGALFGKVDVKIKVEERTGSTSSGRNNGTYILGYRIWNEDKTQVVFEPFGDGVAYRFDRKPFDSNVHNVFVKNEATLSIPLYWLTNGDGADAINSTRDVPNNYIDTEQFEEGNYVLEIFTEDTRGNKSNKFIDIRFSAPPEQPTLNYVINPNKKHSVEVGWEANTDADLLGYRLYYSINTQLSTWQLAADETLLTKDKTSIYFESPEDFIQPISDDIYFFYLVAVDSTGAESKQSDIYSRSPHQNGTNYPNVLIVDGFDRFGGTGGWPKSIHEFNTAYFIPMFVADSLNISSAEDEAVGAGKVSLTDYDVVSWFVGDGGGPNKSFTTEQQIVIQNYLESGGNLIVSGSEIGLDLATNFEYTQESDSAFFKDYFKSEFIYNGNSQMDLAAGVEGSVFGDLEINLGQIYQQNYPDDINPVDGAETVLNYNAVRNDGENRIAGIGYKGTFGQSTIPGGLLYLSFALETEANMIHRKDFMTAALNYFDLITSVENDLTEDIPSDFRLDQNYPNPFNPSTKIKFSLPNSSRIKLVVYNSLGQQVVKLINGDLSAGNHSITWNTKSQNYISSGVYYARLSATSLDSDNKQIKTIKMILLK